MMKDLVNRIDLEETVEYQTIATDGDTTGDAVEVVGFRGVAVVALVGDITDGDFEITIEAREEEGGDWQEVGEDGLVGTFETIEGGVEGNQKVGLKGSYYEIRAEVTAANTTDGGDLGVVVVKSRAYDEPVEY